MSDPSLPVTVTESLRKRRSYSRGRPDDIGRRFAAALLPRLFGTNPRSHHKGATGRFELETNGFQFYAIANLDKTFTTLLSAQIAEYSGVAHGVVSLGTEAA